MYRGIRGARRTGLCLIAVVALAACGSSSSTGASSAGAQALLKQTFSSGHTVKSGVLGFSLTLNPTGSSTLTTPVSFSLSGPFQSRGTGNLPASNFTVNVSALGKHGLFGVLSTGTSGYVTLSGASYLLPQAQFQKLESSFSSIESSSAAAGHPAGLSRLGISPLHWLKNPSIVGSETVGGADTTHIRSGVDVVNLLSDLNTFLAKTAKTQAAAANIPVTIAAATQAKIAAAVKNATVDVWTGKSDTMLRRLALNLTVPVTGQISTLLGGLSSAGIGLTIQYSNLNQTQSISTPTNIRPYSEFTTKLQGLLGQIQGAVGATGLGGAAASGASSSSGSATTQTPAPALPKAASVQKYTACIQQASGDVTKMQKCAALLTGR